MSENKYGVKVGDIFEAVWGYDESRSTFFQVVSLAGTESVRVREVHPPVISESCYGCYSADRVYQTKVDGLLPPARSIFTKDPVRGDIKRLKMWSNVPHFRMSSYANAYLCGEKTESYESWGR